METRPAAANLRAMDSRTVTITLEVQVDGDDVRGTARAIAETPATPDPRVFAGWLGLIGAIDALLGFAPDAGAAARAIAVQEGAQTR
jgi:hypothetical protein